MEEQHVHVMLYICTHIYRYIFTYTYTYTDYTCEFCRDGQAMQVHIAELQLAWHGRSAACMADAFDVTCVGVKV